MTCDKNVLLRKSINTNTDCKVLYIVRVWYHDALQGHDSKLNVYIALTHSTVILKYT